MFGMSFNALSSFIVTCLIIESTPGPNMGYLAILSAADGRRRGYAAVAGIALGLLMVGIAAALGLAAVISNSPAAYQALRWGGVLYMLWLAWDSWRGGAEIAPEKTDGWPQSAKYFRRGLITNLLNPKAAAFYIAILPGFVDTSAHVTAQTVTLTVIYVSIATAIHALIVTLAGTARAFLEDPARNLVVRRILALALAGIALWFAWSTGISAP